MAFIWKIYLTNVTTGGSLDGFKVDRYGDLGKLTAKTESEVEKIESSNLFKLGKVWLLTKDVEHKQEVAEQTQKIEKETAQIETGLQKYFTVKEREMISKLSEKSLKVWLDNLKSIYLNEYPPTPVEEESEGIPPFDDISATDIKKLLNERQIKYKVTYSKSQLYDLLLSENNLNK